MTKQDLEMRVDELKNDLKDAETERDAYEGRLVSIVDRVAEIGLIENNPHTKFLYVEGKREL